MTKTIPHRQGDVVKAFVPFEDFERELPHTGTKQKYLKGRFYNIRERNSMLAGLAEQWEKEGLVRITSDINSGGVFPGKIEGAGKVLNN